MKGLSFLLLDQALCRSTGGLNPNAVSLVNMVHRMPEPDSRGVNAKIPFNDVALFHREVTFLINKTAPFPRVTLPIRSSIVSSIVSSMSQWRFGWNLDSVRDVLT